MSIEFLLVSKLFILLFFIFFFQLDCLVFAALCQFIYVPFEGFEEYIKTETPNLLTLVNNIKDEYWKDWDTLCSEAEANSKSTKEDGKPEDDATAKEKKAEEEKKQNADKKKAEEEKKQNAEKKKKEKEERERKKKEEKEERERKKKEAKEKAAAEKEKASKDEKPAEGGEPEVAQSEGGDKGVKSESGEPDNKASDTKAGEA